MHQSNNLDNNFIKQDMVKYMTLWMPENHNSIVFGAVVRVPQDLILNIKFNMISSDEFSGSEHIGLKEAAREMKIFIVPLTESYLKKAESVSELEIGIELVKRRWQENIQIIFPRFSIFGNRFRVEFLFQKVPDIFYALLSSGSELCVLRQKIKNENRFRFGSF